MKNVLNWIGLFLASLGIYLFFGFLIAFTCIYFEFLDEIIPPLVGYGMFLGIPLIFGALKKKLKTDEKK